MSLSRLLASGIVEFADGKREYAEVTLSKKSTAGFITIGVGSGGFNGMSAQLTPVEFISGPYDDVILGLKLSWLRDFILRVGPEKVSAADILECFNSR